MLLRIEKGFGDSIYSTPASTHQLWPANLPPLDTLEREKVDTEASAYFKNSTAEIYQILVKDEQIKAIFEAFDNRLAYKLFQSGDNVYYIAARPLLPHETLNNFSSFPEEKELALPFSCSN